MSQVIKLNFLLTLNSTNAVVTIQYLAVFTQLHLKYPPRIHYSDTKERHKLQIFGFVDGIRQTKMSQCP